MLVEVDAPAQYDVGSDRIHWPVADDVVAVPFQNVRWTVHQSEAIQRTRTSDAAGSWVESFDCSNWSSRALLLYLR